jgi:hypothetical protein
MIYVEINTDAHTNDIIFFCYRLNVKNKDINRTRGEFILYIYLFGPSY